MSLLRRLDFLPQKFNVQVKPHWFVVLLTLGISLDLLPDIPSSTTSMTTCKQPCKVQKTNHSRCCYFMTVSLYSCVCNFFPTHEIDIAKRFYFSIHFLKGLIQNFRNNEVQRFKRKVLSSTLYCAPIHYAVQNSSNF